MKPAADLVLLGAALLLISGAYGDLCSTVKEDVALFLHGSTDEYVAYVARYNTDDTAVQENARLLKQCVDDKLSKEDKQNASSGLEKIYSSRLC
ncbi:major allergen I polypeptide chain 1-like [Octodon degus]|uniref:Major allergen I polypeptide chain 1-like n=1 Tax=Octodon degus TaxID=10160 RepID=A0A6P6EY65_OCTDE|nr:major allergen I polypeptide chain 1-like [Octodon degus]